MQPECDHTNTMQPRNAVHWRKTLCDYLRNSRPIGAAFAIAIMLILTIQSIAIVNAPVAAFIDFYFAEVPVAHVAAGTDRVENPTSIGEEFPDCYWMPLDDFEAKRHLADFDTMPRARVRCTLPDPIQDSVSGRSGATLAGKFAKAPHWERIGMVPGVRNLAPSLKSLFWIGLVLIPVTWLLVGKVDVRRDLGRAFDALLHRPWIVLAAPAAATVISTLGAVFAVPDPEGMEKGVELFAALIPAAWMVVLILPFAEEAVFRQWLYVRIIRRLPTWVAALGSSWAFMLTHILNPQVGALATYLPTMFIIGLVLFWLRHRFASFSLAVIAHMVHNGLFYGIGSMQPGVN